jgi:excisionase family DNA binding protein
MSAAEQIDKTLTIEQAAAFLRDQLGMDDITPRVVDRLAHEKKLPFFKVGRSRRIFGHKLVEHIRRLQVEAERESTRKTEARKRK